MRRLDLVFLDLLLIAAATVCALVLRDNLEVSAERLVALGPYLGITVIVAAGIIPALGINRAIWRFTSITDCLRILIATAAMVAVAVSVGFGINRLDGVARALPILQAILIAFALISVRVMVRLRHIARVRSSHPPSQSPSPTAHAEAVLIVGNSKLTELFLQSVAEFASNRMRIAGLLGRSDRQTGRSVHGYPILGTPVQIVRILNELEVHGVVVDRIIVCTAFESLLPQAQKALLEVERTTAIRLDFLEEKMGFTSKDMKPTRAPSSSVFASPAVFSISAADLHGLAQHPYWRIKRGFDIAAATLLLVALAPLIFLVATLVAADVGVPVAFWQQRPGRGGQPFRLYKFRTMAAAHDDRGERVPDEQRLSAIGSLLRRSRLDELPQLFNILIGEMSFVGPRPLLPVDQPEADFSRLLVRPGLTGWAQVHGGRELSVAEKLPLDVWYIKHASLALDVRILLQTAIMLIRGENRNEAAIQKAHLDLGIAQSGETAEALIIDDRFPRLPQAANQAAI